MMREAFDGKDPICVYAVYDGSFIFLHPSTEIYPFHDG